MSGVISTGNHPKAHWPGINELWGLTYNQHSPEYPDLFEVGTSRQKYEEDVQSIGMGLIPVKDEGDSLAYDSMKQGFVSRYLHLTYAMGYIVTMEELEDNLYAYVSKNRTTALAFSTNQTLETIGANYYNLAFSTSVGGDGVSLLNAAHPVAGGGTFSNILPVAADLSETALEDITIQIMQAEDDRGHKIGLMPKCLHIHPSEWYEANRILESVLQNNTANNATNVLKATNALPGGIKMNHYFTDPDAWFVGTNCPNGLKWMWRRKPVFDQDNDFDTKNAKAAVTFRASVGHTDPRGLYGSPGA